METVCDRTLVSEFLSPVPSRLHQSFDVWNGTFTGMNISQSRGNKVTLGRYLSETLKPARKRIETGSRYFFYHTRSTRDSVKSSLEINKKLGHLSRCFSLYLFIMGLSSLLTLRRRSTFVYLSVPSRLRVCRNFDVDLPPHPKTVHLYLIPISFYKVEFLSRNNFLSRIPTSVVVFVSRTLLLNIPSSYLCIEL